MDNNSLVTRDIVSNLKAKLERVYTEMNDTCEKRKELMSLGPDFPGFDRGYEWTLSMLDQNIENLEDMAIALEEEIQDQEACIDWNDLG